MIRIVRNTMGIQEKSDLELAKIGLSNLDQTSGDATVELANIVAGNMDAIVELAEIVARLEAMLARLEESTN